MKNIINNTNSDLMKNIADNLGHVYYSMLLEPGTDPEAKAIRGEVIGNPNKIFMIPTGDDTYFNHRFCEALGDNEKQRLREILVNAMNSLSTYEIELQVENKKGRAVWLINKGCFKQDPGTKRIIQQGLIVSIPARMLKRNEFGTGDMRYHSVAGLMNDYVFSVRCKNGEVIETIHGGACKDVTGYSEEEFFDDEDLWFKMVHPRDKDLILERANKMAQGEQVDEIIHRIKHKNGQTRWVKSVIIPHHDEFGNVFLYDGVIRDITDQIVEQQHLEQISYMNELLLDATPYPMILMQNDGLVLKANRAGYEMGAVDEQSCSTMWKKEIDATCEFRKMLGKSMETDSIVVGDLAYEDKIYDVTIVPNEPDLLLACLHDVTKDRSMSDRLEEDKMVMQAVFENTITSIMLIDIEGKFEAINKTASKVIGMAQAEVVGRSLNEIFPEDEAETRMSYIRQVSQSHQALKCEETMNGKQLVTMVIPVLDKHSDVIKIAIFSKDVTQMKKAEANLIETYQVLTAIVENAPLVIIGLDKDRRVILWNDGAEIMSKIKSEDSYNKEITELYDSADDTVSDAINKAYEGEAVELKNATVTILDGTTYTVRVSFVPKLDAKGNVSGVIVLGSMI